MDSQSWGGGRRQSQNIRGFWKVADIHGFVWTLTRIQSSPEWDGQGQGKQDPGRFRPGPRWVSRGDWPASRGGFSFRVEGRSRVYVSVLCCHHPEHLWLFMQHNRKSQSGGFLNNYFRVDGQQDNSDASGNDFIFNGPLEALTLVEWMLPSCSLLLCCLDTLHMVLCLKDLKVFLWKYLQEV